MARSHEILQQRAATVTALTELKDKLKNEKRTMNADEQASYDKMFADLRAYDKEYELAQTLEREERAAAAHHITDNTPQPGAAPSVEDQKKETRQAIADYMKHGPMNISAEQRDLLAATGLIQGVERRAAQSAVTANVGAEMVKTEYLNEFERHLKSFGGMFEAGRIVRTSTGATLPWPYVNDTSQVGEILAEATATNQQAIATGVVNIGSFVYSSKEILVPIQLMQDDGFGFINEIPSLAAERIGRIANTHFTVGTGSGQPQGVVAAAADSTVEIAINTITRAKLLDLIHSVDPAYRRRGSNGSKLMFNDNTLKQIIALSIGSGDDRPLWVPSMRDGEPDTIEGYSYVVNQDMPSTATNDNKCILFGDFSKYIVRIVSDVMIKRADERHIEKFAVGFYGFARMDGKLINTGAVKYLNVVAA